HFLLRREKLGQLRTIAQRLRLHCLGHTFIQPVRAAPSGKIVDEGMCKFVFQNAGKIRRDGIKSVDGNAKFAVVQGTRPRWRLGYIKERLVGIKSNCDRAAWLHSKLSHQIVVVRFEHRNKLTAKSLGSLLSLIVKREVAAVVL